jgi:hypothetical protein
LQAANLHLVDLAARNIVCYYDLLMAILKNRYQERVNIMKPWVRSLLTGLASIWVALAAVAVANAETCTLEIRRLESQTNGTFNASDYIYRETNPQSFQLQIGPDGKNRIQFAGSEDQAAAFKKIVKKQPQYESDHPFRGVAKFGTQEFAFALDESIPDAEKKKADSDKKNAKSADDAKKDSNDAKSDSALDKLSGSLIQALSSSDDENSPTLPKSYGFNRLYFDANHNGDLTDDKVIEVKSMPGLFNSSSYTQFQFPRVDVTIDVDGTKVDYAFFVRGYINVTREYCIAGVQLNSATYREGDITLDGKKRHLVLLDHNSNARFDDEFKLSKDVAQSDGQIYPTQGDMLLIDPDQANAGYTSPYEVTANSYQHYVSKMVDIEGRFYDIKISPAGDKLTLTPSTVQLGIITNPNAKFSAVIYSGDSILKITGQKDSPVSIPEGEWKLLSYTIDQTEPPVPDKPAEKKDEPKAKSALLALGKVLENMINSANPSITIGPSYSIVTAQGNANYKPVKVRKGESVEFPFGPPFKPSVTLDYIQNINKAKQAQLGMSLIGSVGELVTDMMVNGGRPSKPAFTIKDPKGEVVQTGSFEYG